MARCKRVIRGTLFLTYRTRLAEASQLLPHTRVTVARAPHERLTFFQSILISGARRRQRNRRFIFCTMDGPPMPASSGGRVLLPSNHFDLWLLWIWIQEALEKETHMRYL